MRSAKCSILIMEKCPSSVRSFFCLSIPGELLDMPLVQMDKYVPGSPMGDCCTAPFEALVLVRLDILVFF